MKNPVFFPGTGLLFGKNQFIAAHVSVYIYPQMPSTGETKVDLISSYLILAQVVYFSVDGWIAENPRTVMFSSYHESIS